MPPPTPDQVRRRDRLETLIGLAAPVLDFVLAVGDRVSRIVERDDLDYIPPPSGIEPPAGAIRSGDAGARAE